MKINIGCGWRNFGSEWIHIDGGNYDHLDSNDIFNLPYNNNSVDLIYASHVLEYFDINEAKKLLKKWQLSTKTRR
jgi:predicted SAM-dependent methyltransferase